MSSIQDRQCPLSGKGASPLIGVCDCNPERTLTEAWRNQNRESKACSFGNRA